MRGIQRLACTAALLAGLVVGTANATSRPLDSGVRGLVLYGPTCPVQRPGQSCTRPYQASIAIKHEPAGTVVARVRSAANGRFTVRLRIGCYRLQPSNLRPYPRATAQTICVRRHHFTAVTIRFDSGIR